MRARFFLLHLERHLIFMKKYVLFLLFSFCTVAQNSNELGSLLKREQQKNNWTNYNTIIQEIKDLMLKNSIYEVKKDTIITCSNYLNSEYYQALKGICTEIEALRSNLINGLDYNKDKKIIAHIQDVFNADNQFLNQLYLKRNKYLKVSIDRIQSPDAVDALPKEVCERYSENGELLYPTHQNCKDKGLTNLEEKNCFENFIRTQFSNVLSEYISDLYLEETLNLSVMITFIIDKEGKLDFVNFSRSTGSLHYDLMVYKAFQSIQRNTFFCPARKDNKSVSIYYNLPVKMLIPGS